ncbi:hypothetical protein RB195_014981 [Necator americanus]|uniref:Uncharacterized protein n=1 Tax=Necator americanus TaxID=51031 RepID=A0ABR1E2F8_NECAM
MIKNYLEKLRAPGAGAPDQARPQRGGSGWPAPGPKTDRRRSGQNRTTGGQGRRLDRPNKTHSPPTGPKPQRPPPVGLNSSKNSNEKVPTRESRTGPGDGAEQGTKEGQTIVNAAAPKRPSKIDGASQEQDDVTDDQRTRHPNAYNRHSTRGVGVGARNTRHRTHHNHPDGRRGEPTPATRRTPNTTKEVSTGAQEALQAMPTQAQTGTPPGPPGGHHKPPTTPPPGAPARKPHTSKSQVLPKQRGPAPGRTKSPAQTKHHNGPTSRRVHNTEPAKHPRHINPAPPAAAARTAASKRPKKAARGREAPTPNQPRSRPQPGNTPSRPLPHHRQTTAKTHTGNQQRPKTHQPPTTTPGTRTGRKQTAPKTTTRQHAQPRPHTSPQEKVKQPGAKGLKGFSTITIFHCFTRVSRDKTAHTTEATDGAGHNQGAPSTKGEVYRTTPERHHKIHIKRGPGIQPPKITATPRAVGPGGGRQHPAQHANTSTASDEHRPNSGARQRISRRVSDGGSAPSRHGQQPAPARTGGYRHPPTGGSRGTRAGEDQHPARPPHTTAAPPRNRAPTERGAQTPMGRVPFKQRLVSRRQKGPDTTYTTQAGARPA